MSFRVALSGLNAATAHLETVSNNIANVNTTGFKQSRAEFMDLLSSSGTDSSSSGRGTQLASISQLFTQGSLLNTGRNLDLALSGNGFFTVSDDGNQLYTRNGQFHVNKDGFIQNSNDQLLQAYQADAAGDITTTIGDLFVSTADNPPVPTANLQVGVNLSAGELAPLIAFDPVNPQSFNSSTSVGIFDSLGNQHVLTSYFAKTGTNAWDLHLTLDGALTGGPNPITFSSAGTLLTPASGVLPFTVAPLGAAVQNIDMNLASSTQFGGPFGVNQLTQDGFSSGHLTGMDVSAEGLVVARYSNGQTRNQGQLVLANFPNVQGLAQLGLGNWAETADSGAALLGKAGTSNLGLVNAGALESSNVDVTEMLVELITAQRNFQANAKTIETADSITQAIINLR